MNMTLHGIDNPVIENRDSLSEDHADKRNAYTLVLANPPFNQSDWGADRENRIH